MLQRDAQPGKIGLSDTRAKDFERSHVGGISERMKEVKRRRHRREKLKKFQTRLKKATTSEKAMIAEKIRRLSPGAEQVIENLGLVKK
jgi:hypothetical protein